MADEDTPTVLKKIVAARKSRLPEIRERFAHVDPDTLPTSERSLYRALGGGEHHARTRNRFIMECKSASPSLGEIRPDYHPGDLARIYSRYADAISVLCEPDFFNGDYTHLTTVAASTHLPVLCKDFIIDKVQLKAARYSGADAVLLMLSILEDQEYRELSAEATRLGLDVLTEVISEEEGERALALGARIIGINHRNLHDLSIDLDRSRVLGAQLPPDTVIVAESGIRDHHTVQLLSPRANAFLVGSQLTSSPDVDRACRELVYGESKVCGLQAPEEAQAARAAGAVYGGMIFVGSSKRNVSRETAQEIAAFEPGLTFVAVSKRTSHWEELASIPGIDILQIHTPRQGGVEEEITFIKKVAEEVESHGAPTLWRALPMDAPDTPEVAAALAAETELVDRIILDSGPGGTGKSFDWSRIPEEHRGRFLVAGGIGPKNAAAAAGQGCAGVDMNSRVEYPSSAGQWAASKDPAAIRQAFEALKHAPLTNTNTRSNAQ